MNKTVSIGAVRFGAQYPLALIEMADRTMKYSLSESNRIGDHMWHISDVRRFRGHYPGWECRYGLEEIPDQGSGAQAARL